MSPVFWLVPFWRRKPHQQLSDHHTAAAASTAIGQFGSIPGSPASYGPSSFTQADDDNYDQIDRFYQADQQQDQRLRRVADSSITATAGTPPFFAPPEHRRHHGSADLDSLTTPKPSHPTSASTQTQTPVLDQQVNRRLKAQSQQPAYPVASFEHAAEPAAAAVAHAALSLPQPAALSRGNNTSLIQSPFRSLTKATPASTHRLRRLPAARLWNPTNSTPRLPQSRKRRPSSPPVPSVPLKHPALETSSDIRDPIATGAGDYPLLTLSEQRQSRYSHSTHASLQIERSGISDHRISLPRSVRASYDGKRSSTRVATPLDAGTRLSNSKAIEETVVYLSAKSKGKQKATMAPDNEDTRRSYSRDLERGPDVMDPRVSNVSAGDGIGSAISSSNSSIMGEDVQPDAGEEWGPQHPCFPHLNPHVPLDSIEYTTTRIIRVKRDWLVAGDLAPTFSNLYPEILDPAGVSEQEFRRIVEKLNGELIPIFDPSGFRNMLDSVLGLVTGWLWDDFGLTAAKSRLSSLEKWIEKWNQEMEKTMASDEGTIPPKLIPLRQTGYMTVRVYLALRSILV